VIKDIVRENVCRDIDVAVRKDEIDSTERGDE
jgi:hypothetical protein